MTTRLNMDTSEDLEALVGLEADFYGVDGTCFKLDDVVYEAIEDEAGLRELRVCHDPHRFHRLPIARVVVEQTAFSDECYELIDLHDEHSWLTFGTEIYDLEGEAHGKFTFDYTPKAAPVVD
jgi:hypothetical protein